MTFIERAPGRALRVLHLGKYYPPYRGGMESHLETLCQELRSEVDLSVVVSNVGPESQVDTVAGIRVTRIGRIGSVASCPICPSILAEMRRVQADIVHVHLPNPLALAAHAAVSHGARLVVTYHSDIIRQKILGKLIRPLMDGLLARSNAVIATSPAAVRYSPTLNRFRDKCSVIPLGIALDPMNRDWSQEAAAVRAQYGDRIVLAVGRLVSYKGFEYLIDAMQRVSGRLVLIGEGPLRQRLEEQIRAANLGGRVALLGAMPEVEPYYHACDVFVLPSVEPSEAFGLVQVEAMACGKPVINTRLPSGAPFVSPDGVTGLTVEPRDSAALSAAINRLLDDPPLCARFGQAGRERAAQEFSASVMARRTTNLYQQVSRENSIPLAAA